MSILSERLRQHARETDDLALAVEAMEDRVIEYGRIAKAEQEKRKKLEAGVELTYADKVIAKRSAEYLEDLPT